QWLAPPRDPHSFPTRRSSDLDCAEAGGVLDELHSGAYGVGGRGVATHVKRDNRAEALELAPRGLVSWVARRAGIARQSDVWMTRDRKSTRLNSSHRTISYAVF